MKIALLKSPDEKLGIQRVAEQCVKVVYIRAMDWSSTMSGTTGEVHWRMCQLGWYLVTQTVYVNLPDIKF